MGDYRKKSSAASFSCFLTIHLSHQKQHLMPVRTPHNGFSPGGLIIPAANLLFVPCLNMLGHNVTPMFVTSPEPSTFVP